MNSEMIFYQLFESQSSTYTYLLADPESSAALLIDPVIETIERDLRLIKELGLRLEYVFDTHIHADHISSAGELRKRTGAKTAAGAAAQVSCVDIQLHDGQELEMGKIKIRALATPGHTASCMSFLTEGMIFTGDSLMIRSAGRTDFQEGNSESLFDSVRQKIFSLPDETKIYPAHDYQGIPYSSVALEKKFNTRLSLDKNKEQFKKIMSELKLPNPKKMYEAIPANLSCGKKTENTMQKTPNSDGIPEVSAEDVQKNIGKVRIIDVRGADEFTGELGHIEGAELVTLGSPLTEFLSKGSREESLVFVCRLGGRSAKATAEALRLGYKNAVSMKGGMQLWNDKKLPKSSS
jgi:glyoxylase-like metal-dependent hydrolase (beta-lactamase superfamily II)/rhodanese-related sulfurtransferase